MLLLFDRFDVQEEEKKLLTDFNQSMNERKRVWTKQRKRKKRRRIGYNWRFLLLFIILKSPKGICSNFLHDWRTRWISSKSISSKSLTVRQVPYDCNVSLLADVNRPMHLMWADTAARTPEMESSKIMQKFLSRCNRRANSRYMSGWGLPFDGELIEFLTMGKKRNYRCRILQRWEQHRRRFSHRFSGDLIRILSPDASHSWLILEIFRGWRWVIQSSTPTDFQFGSISLNVIDDFIQTFRWSKIFLGKLLE